MHQTRVCRRGTSHLLLHPPKPSTCPPEPKAHMARAHGPLPGPPTLCPSSSLPVGLLHSFRSQVKSVEELAFCPHKTQPAALSAPNPGANRTHSYPSARMAVQLHWALGATLSLVRVRRS